MPRQIPFEGRLITVPDDATDEEVSQILAAPPAAAAGAGVFPAPGTDPAASNAAVAATVQGDQPVPPEPTLVESILRHPVNRYSGLALQNIRRGLADFAGIPVDATNIVLGTAAKGLESATNATLRAIGQDAPPDRQGFRFTQHPVGGGEFIDRALQGFGLFPEPKPPENFPERMVSRGFKEVGGALPVVGGAVSFARAIGLEAARKLPFLARMFVEPAAIDPVKYATKEGFTAAAAGTGAGLADEAASLFGYKPGSLGYNLSDTAGAFGGVGTASLASMLMRGGGTIAKALFARDNFASQVAKEDVVDRLANNSTIVQKHAGEAIDTQPLIDAINSGTPVSKTIPGFVDSTASVAKDPGLANVEFAARSNPVGSAIFNQNKRTNTAAIDEALGQVAPQGNPGDFRAGLEASRRSQIINAEAAAQEAQRELEQAILGTKPQTTPQAQGTTIRSAVDDALQRHIAEAERAQAAAAATADTAAGRLPPTSDPAVRGNVVRSTLEDRRDVARQATEDAYSQTASGGREVSATDLTGTLDRVNAGLTETEKGLVPRGTIERVRQLGVVPEPDVPKPGVPAPPAEPPPTTSLKEATSLRTELQRRQRAALADPHAEQGGRDAARVLGQYIDAVEQFIRSNVSAEEGALLDAARGAKTAEADAFTRAGDPVAQVLQRSEGGNPRIRDERVAGQFVNPATEAPLQRLFAEADTPQVRGAIRDEIAARLPPEARANPEKLDRFLQDFEIPLRHFPGLRDEIAAASSTRRAVTDAEAAVTTKRQEFAGDSRALADTTRRDSSGQPALLSEQVPERFVTPAGNRDLDALFKRADTPEVRNAIEDHILGKADATNSSADRIRQFITEYAEPLKEFPGVRDRLEAAAKARSGEVAATAAEKEVKGRLGTDEKTGTSPVGKYLRYGDERSTEAMAQALAHPKPGQAMEELLTTAGNAPETIAGARKTFFDLMEKEARSGGNTTRTADGKQPWLPNTWREFLDKHKTAAERLWRDNPEDLKRVNEIVDALQGSDLASSSRITNTSGTAQSIGGGALSPEVITSRVYAYKRGQTSLGFTLGSIAAVAARRIVRSAQAEAIQKLMFEALTDPKLAAELLAKHNPANRVAMSRTAKGWLGAEAPGILDMLGGDDEEDPVKGAIMKKDK